MRLLLGLLVALTLTLTPAAFAGINVFIGSPTIPALSVNGTVVAGPLDATGGMPGPVISSGGAASTANLWMDQNGGSCVRSAAPVDYTAGNANSCSTLQAACTAAASGDTVLIRSGTNYDLNINGCSKASMTTFRVPDDQDITAPPFAINNVDFVTLDGGTQMAKVTATVDDQTSVFSMCADNLTLSHLEVDGTGHDGDAFQVGWPQNCTSSNLKVSGNLVYGLVYKGGNHTDCLQSASSLSSMTIEANRFAECGDGAMQITNSGWGAFDPFVGTDNLVIRNNWINNKINIDVRGSILFESNSYVGGSSVQFNAASSGVVTMYGNVFDIFQNFDCTTIAGYGTFRYNVSDVACPAGTNSTQTSLGTAVFVGPGGAAGAWDLHLKTGANAAVDIVPSGFYAAGDIDGGARPVGVSGDAGADER